MYFTVSGLPVNLKEPIVVQSHHLKYCYIVIKDDDCATIGLLVWDRWSCISDNDLLKNIDLQ